MAFYVPILFCFLHATLQKFDQQGLVDIYIIRLKITQSKLLPKSFQFKKSVEPSLMQQSVVSNLFLLQIKKHLTNQDQKSKTLF